MIVSVKKCKRCSQSKIRERRHPQPQTTLQRRKSRRNLPPRSPGSRSIFHGKPHNRFRNKRARNTQRTRKSPQGRFTAHIRLKRSSLRNPSQTTHTRRLRFPPRFLLWLFQSRRRRIMRKDIRPTWS